MRLENDLKIQEACIQTYILPDQFSYIFQGFKESMFPIISKVVSIKKKECFFKEKNEENVVAVLLVVYSDTSRC